MIAFIAALLALQQAPLATRDGELEAAIASLTNGEREINIRYIAEALKLPELLQPSQWNANAFDWSGPVGESSSEFAANYLPKRSIFGITRLTIVWKFAGVGIEQGSVFNSLVLTFSPGRCPSLERLTSSLGVAPKDGFTPGLDLGSQPMKVYFVRQPEGQAVQVSFAKGNSCHVTIGHTRPF
jgi:hypothetical protein